MTEIKTTKNSVLKEFHLKKFTPRPVIQHEEMDCGPAAMASLIRSYGVPIKIWDIKRYLPSTPNGNSLSDIYSSLNGLGFSVDIYNIDDVTELLSFDQPMIVLLTPSGPNGTESNHFVILKKRKDGLNFDVVDPAWGNLVVSAEKIFNSMLKQILVVAPPSSGKISLRLREFKISEIFHITNLSWKDFWIITLISITWSLLSVLPPLFFGTLVDSFSEAVTTQTFDKSYLLTLIILCVYLGQDGLGYLNEVIGNKIFNRLEYQFMRSLMKKVLSINMQSFISRRTSDFFSFFSSAQGFLSWITETYSSLVINIFSFLFILFSIGTKSYLLLSLTLLNGLFIGFVAFILAKKKKQRIYKQNIIQGRGSSQFADILSHFKMIKAYKAEHLFFRKWYHNVIKSVRMSYETRLIAINYTYASYMLRSLSTVLILYFGVQLVIQKSITIGELMAIWGLSTNLLSMVLSFESLISSSLNSKVGFDRYLSLIVEIEESGRHEIPSAAKTRDSIIEFKDVSFKYSSVDQKNTLNNVSFSIPKGKVIGISGSSGAGKSSVLGILSGLYHPSSGEVFFSEKKNSILLVDQDIRLFSGTLKDNLMLTSKDADQSKINHLIEKFGLSKAINSSPLGLNTHINDLNRNLSGGEVQRLLIVRALLYNPEVLILDEPTSSLDSDTERDILNSILAWVRENNKTLIFASHRQQMFQHTDLIFTFKNGRLVEQGSYDQLFESESEFNRLFLGGDLERK
jgi:ATP-binding cassette subfamily B protein